MMKSAIPTTYEVWVHCITMKCTIPLTPKFARARLAALEMLRSAEAAAFATLYSETHLNRIITVTVIGLFGMYLGITLLVTRARPTPSTIL